MVDWGFEIDDDEGYEEERYGSGIVEGWAMG